MNNEPLALTVLGSCYCGKQETKLEWPLANDNQLASYVLYLYSPVSGNQLYN